jgi:tetratricopeptide (TPR) repeat protein
LDANHPELATALSNLAMVMQDQGELDAAKAMYQRALSIKEAALGPNHPSVAPTLHNLATLLHQRGEHAEAKALMKRARAINEVMRGKSHPHTAKTKAGVRHINRKKACSVCGVRDVKLQLCGKCNLKYYCSADCQV